MYRIGFDLGGTKCAAVLCRDDDVLNPLDRAAFATADFPAPEACIEHLAQLTDTMLAQQGAAAPEIIGIGVSCGGPLDSRAGIIIAPPNLPNWLNIPIVEILRRRFNAPVYLQNDANAGAVAEWRYGAGRGADHVLFLTCGTGMGAGLILNGKLYAGTNDLAGECGHWRLAPFGPVGFGKAGSFEGFCSGGGIAQLASIRAREILQVGGKLDWCRSPADLPLITAQTLAQAADNGDAAAREIYAEVGDYLGRGAALIIDMLNPQKIIIGSIFARAEKLLRAAMERAAAREALTAAAEKCQIVAAQLGEKIGDVAALALASGDF